MVERIMLFKLNDPSTRHEVARLAQAALADVPGVDSLSVGVPADASSERSWDMSIVLGVANVALLGSVLESESFKRWLDGTLQPLCAVIKAWSFERL